MAKLAELGVAVPDEYRREVAMAGDWQVLSERRIIERIKKEEDVDVEDTKSNGLNVGVRKRKLEGQDGEEEAVEPITRRVWGSTQRTYPGRDNDESELDTLLNATSASVRGINSSVKVEERQVALDSGTNGPSTYDRDRLLASDTPFVKREESTDGNAIVLMPVGEAVHVPAKDEDVSLIAGVVFKKRKSKMIRQS